ncbi:MAG: DUF4255 domain-containing protein [Firmicutes bacterium]|nr:DUF4255 domain-containing protein [Bacillota bacterium]
MIHEIDAAIESFLTQEILGTAGVEVSFDAPSKEWAQKRTSPMVNTYLYDIREDANRRQVGVYESRNEKGELIARTEPPRFFRLSYMITAYASRPLDEHRLLSAILLAFLPHKVFPERYLTGAVAESALPVLLEIGRGPVENRQISDVWTAFGGELKASLDLVVTMPIPSDAKMVDTPLAESGVVLQAFGTTGQNSVASHKKTDETGHDTR